MKYMVLGAALEKSSMSPSLAFALPHQLCSVADLIALPASSHSVSLQDDLRRRSTVRTRLVTHKPRCAAGARMCAPSHA